MHLFLVANIATSVAMPFLLDTSHHLNVARALFRALVSIYSVELLSNAKDFQELVDHHALHLTALQRRLDLQHKRIFKKIEADK